MRPTFSIIFFTVMSGAGYGLWFLVAVFLLLLWPEIHHGNGLNLILFPDLLTYGLGAGFVLVSSGLISSLWHLGKPMRAWRAFSQWRSSWLSREGVAAILTYLPVVALFGALFNGLWLIPAPAADGDLDSWLWMLTPMKFVTAIALVIGSFATVWCTAHIYASIKPVRAWHNPQVVAGYLLLALFTGALFAWALTSISFDGTRHLDYLIPLIVALAVAGAILKLRYWRLVDEGSASTTGDAIGLGALGSVRSFEQPHTEENYLTQEMGFRIARKHSRKLRMICLLAGFGLPGLLALTSLVFPAFSTPGAWLALPIGMLGVFVERWLFFAEAKHAVMLYYGTRNG
ncbi:dimethyl sulfoxide reductase anchor subunit family protein [Dokdonella sp.]|uniref:dimethyl sulfoxide reductase anchor subunit family protein n=1 Tax=Dokdonella sp. TaxID=2291710 RepID=UPI003C4CC27D